jgi:superfamily II DNA/RNA helicase
VATDIAARGIHVDDISLVVHADPPAEHKAYLHRSGRTARAGNAGTVVTLMTSEQVRDVRDMARAAGIKPTTTRIQGSTHPVLLELAPGERRLTEGLETAAASSPRTRSGGGGGGGGGRNRRRTGRGRTTSGGERPARTPRASGQTSSKGGSGRPRRSSGRTPSRNGTHSAASFSAARR